MFRSWPKLILAVAVLMLSATVAYADGSDDASAVTGKVIRATSDSVTTTSTTTTTTTTAEKYEMDEGPLYLTSNKDVIVRLNEDAASVIVNNPNHAVVMLDSPRVMIVMPRQPGATSFMVLNAAGDMILKKDVIVSNVISKKKYVRIRRMCQGADATCAPAAYYYCPDGCYEVTPIAASPGSTVPPPPAGGAAAAASDAAATAATMGTGTATPEGQTGGQ